MMKLRLFNSQLFVPAFAALALAASVLCLSNDAASAEGGARYCISRSGLEGSGGYTGNCVFSDYQQCLQAAADGRGSNCVENIDYHGAAPAAPTARGSRRAR